MRWIRSSAMTILILVSAVGSIQARTSTDDLCRLTPGDVAAALVVDHWSGHARVFFDSKLYQGLSKLSAADEWRTSAAHRNWIDFLARAEKTLGMPAAQARDELFGEAVVLALHLPADAPMESARLAVEPGPRPEDRRRFDRQTQRRRTRRGPARRSGRTSPRRFDLSRSRLSGRRQADRVLRLARRQDPRLVQL